jgi:hypothetical protein
MKTLAKFALILIGSAPALSLSSLHATTIWNFEQSNNASGYDTNPTPSTGSGTASTVGMTYDGDTDASATTALAGTDTDNTSATNLTWKVRGHSSASSNNNGWNSAAAIATQGAQFAVSTVGDGTVSVSFDWYPSTTSEAKMLIQYTTNGTTYINATAAEISIPTSATLAVDTNTTSANTVLGAYIDTTSGNTWYNDITLNLSASTGATNDPLFAVRLVNASTGTDNVQSTGGTALDNTKGNWSFDDVEVTGTPLVTPEPGTWALLLTGCALLAGVQLVRRSRLA